MTDLSYSIAWATCLLLLKKATFHSSFQVVMRQSRENGRWPVRNVPFQQFEGRANPGLGRGGRGGGRGWSRRTHYLPLSFVVFFFPLYNGETQSRSIFFLLSIVWWWIFQRLGFVFQLPRLDNHGGCASSTTTARSQSTARATPDWCLWLWLGPVSQAQCRGWSAWGLSRLQSNSVGPLARAVPSP